MLAIKFDKEKVKNCADAYKDEHDGKAPYLIMNSKTNELLVDAEQCYLSYVSNAVTSVFSATTSCPNSISVDDKKYTLGKGTKNVVDNWYGCKILIDESLAFGEVHIG